MEVPENIRMEYPAFSNDLVLDCIFQHLTTRDLLTCGLVSKKWNWNSRIFLSEKRNSLAKVKDCQQLKELNDVMAQSIFPLPFNGLFISGGHSCEQSTPPEEFYRHLCEDPFIFTKLKLKLSGQSGLECPLIQFIKKYFQPPSPLEQLEIVSLPSRTESLAQMFQDMELNLQNLKTVKFPLRQYDGLLEEVLSAAENLQKIRGPIGEAEVEIVRKTNKLHALKEFLLEPEGIQMEICEQLTLDQPKLQSIKISSGHYRAYGGDLHAYQKVAIALLLSSADTLEELTIGHLDIIMLTNSENMPVLNKVRHISLGYSSQTDNLEEYPTLRRVNFRRFFPNVVSIEIVATLGARFTSRYISDDFRNSSEEFDCPSVRKIVLTKIDFPTEPVWFEWMKDLFPNVKELEISACNNLGTYLTAVWMTWPDLEQVNVTQMGGKFKDNLDHVFSGLSPEEILGLESKDKEFLKSYQYAAVKTCLQNLKNLQRIVFQAQHCKDLGRREYPHFLSQLSGHLVFERMENLNVQVERKDCQCSCEPCLFLDHLRPFAQFYGQ